MFFILMIGRGKQLGEIIVLPLSNVRIQRQGAGENNRETQHSGKADHRPKKRGIYPVDRAVRIYSKKDTLRAGRHATSVNESVFC